MSQGTEKLLPEYSMFGRTIKHLGGMINLVLKNSTEGMNCRG